MLLAKELSLESSILHTGLGCFILHAFLFWLFGIFWRKARVEVTTYNKLKVLGLFAIIFIHLMR